MTALLTMLVGGIISALLLFLHSRKKIPVWIDNDDKLKGWKQSNLKAVIISTLSSAAVAALFTMKTFTIWFNVSFVVMVAVVVYMFVQSLHTDVKYRLVDRWSLYFASLLTFVPNLFLALEGNVDVAVWVIFMIVTFALVFFPIMGASDSRALFLAAVATVPLFPTGFYFLGLIMFLFFALVYVVAGSVKNHYHEGVPTVLKSIVKGQLSIPAVPFILLPYIILSLDLFTGWVQFLPEDLFWFL